MNARYTGWLFAGLLVGCADAPVPTQPPPPPLPPSDRVEVLELWTGERQVGRVGSQLSQPFRVRASASGVPVSGLEVQWSAEGSTAPVTSTLTDTSGVTGVTWALGPRTGPINVAATVTGRPLLRVVFHASAEAGPAAALQAFSGSGAQLIANTAMGSTLVAKLVDRFGNPLAGHDVRWIVESGSATVSDSSTRTNSQGETSVRVAPQGVVGPVGVRAVHPSGLAALFSLAVVMAPPPPGPPGIRVVLNPSSGFVSEQNGTVPANDTIPAGSQVTWTLYPFDYDLQNVVSVGVPVFQGGDFPYAAPSSISVTFTIPDTYRYIDEHSGATGVIVVK